MNPIFNNKYKTTLCRHWQTTGACTIGVRCVFAHGQAELRNPNDPITLNQDILTDAKMLTAFMTSPFGDVTQINAMVTAQQLNLQRQEIQTLEKALRSHGQHGDHSYANQKERQTNERITINAAKSYLDKPHYDITSDPMVQKRITTAQMKLMVRQVLKLKMHPIILCKVRICEELLEADNVNACTILFNDIMERQTASPEEKKEYERIVEQASQLTIQLIAEEKVKFQRLQREQEILIQRQQEKFHMHQSGGYSGH